MLVKLRQGLQLITYPEDRILPFFDGLITLHEQAFENSRAGGDVDGNHEATSENDEESVSVMPDDGGFWMAEGEAADSGFLDDGPEQVVMHPADALAPVELDAWDADSLGSGSWVDLALDGVWLRAQLTWASPHRTLFMFTSAGGRAHSMSRRTMDRLRTTGLVRLVSDGHVMDNALDAVAQAALRNNLEKPG
jgi:hypothetical protein